LRTFVNSAARFIFGGKKPFAAAANMLGRDNALALRTPSALAADKAKVLI